ncbi:MAG: serine/threonine protein kinase [Pseudomonadota bacterium]|nr:serine/threonine protein kinase [Pseudomonadota bacterium]
MTPVDYSGLYPETILSAIEARGHLTSGRMLALNSYENRVYRVELEDAPPVVAKFYRPERWSDEAILEEHGFSRELAEAEIPVVAPMADEADNTLSVYDGYRYALFPQQGGRWPDLESRRDLAWMGRFLARIHAIGARRPFEYRRRIGVANYGRESAGYLLAEGFIPAHLDPAYRTLADDLLDSVERCFERAGDVSEIRIHGDCHRGNVLWTDAGPHFVDLDDCVNGPAIQDLWMLLAGEREEMEIQLSYVLEGYGDFADLDPRELHLVEALRSLRMMHYAAWLARRWTDPAFPQAFPWFNTARYWENHVLELREQLSRTQEPALNPAMGV